MKINACPVMQVMAGKKAKNPRLPAKKMWTVSPATRTTGAYGKGTFGNPAEGVDLIAAAQSVRAPTRENCGKCHFDGGGGNGVKHGDLDESLYFPDENLDVHMGGEANMQCIDCHVTTDHQILGRMIADNYTIDPKEQVSCEQCHVDQKHEDERINTHLACCCVPDLSYPSHGA